jgi:hypothetical protein
VRKNSKYRQQLSESLSQLDELLTSPRQSPIERRWIRTVVRRCEQVASQIRELILESQKTTLQHLVEQYPAVRSRAQLLWSEGKELVAEFERLSRGAEDLARRADATDGKDLDLAHDVADLADRAHQLTARTRRQDTAVDTTYMDAFGDDVTRGGP